MATEAGQVELGSVTKWLSGGTPNRAVDHYWSGDIPWISASTLKEAEVSSSDQCVTKEAVSLGSKMAPVNSTLLLVRGSALHNEIRAGLVVKPICFNQDVKALIPSANVYPKFLTYSILGRQTQLLDLVSSAGNTAGVLDTKLVQAFKIWLPDVNEQRAIVTALSDVDALIAGLEKLIAKKRDLKQAAMQQLLTGQIRLPGFSGEWAHKQLGDVICEISDGGTPSTSDSRNFGGDVPWVVIDDIQQKIDMTRSTLTEKGLQACAARLWPQGALIVSTGATIGEVGILQVSAATKQGICGIIFDPRLARPEYMQYWFVNNKKLLLSKAQGSSIKEIRAPTLVTLPVSIPEIDEQAAIAGILGDMDVDISIYESRLVKTRELKQGMMQELLTGRTRLV